jgi:hypothetical protein
MRKTNEIKINLTQTYIRTLFASLATSIAHAISDAPPP